MKIMLFGSTGQVGHELLTSLKPHGEIFSERIDFLKPLDIVNAIEKVRPDLVVNAAAYTDVDKAQIDMNNYAINAEAVSYIAKAVKAFDATLIHYSTDYVYDGEGNTPKTEKAIPNPLNEYGKAKLQGEAAIQTIGCDHLIFRVQRIYSARRNNFLKKMLELAKVEDEIYIAGNSHGVPTSAKELARITGEIVGRGQEFMKARTGVYNLSCRTHRYPSWHDFASEIFIIAEELGMEGFRLKKITPCRDDEFPRPAPRPKNTKLDISHFITSFYSSPKLINPRLWNECLKDCLEEIAGL